MASERLCLLAADERSTNPKQQQQYNNERGNLQGTLKRQSSLLSGSTGNEQGKFPSALWLANDSAYELALNNCNELQVYTIRVKSLFWPLEGDFLLGRPTDN